MTIILAWINAHYDYNYEGLFFFTFVIDLSLISNLLFLTKC